MKRLTVIVAGIWVFCMLCGCSFQSDERIKLRDLDFTVLSEEKMSKELEAIVEERKTRPFQLTYSDNEFLYICIGYGEQTTGGYSIAVNELYLTENSINVSTSLLGPGPEEKNKEIPSYPYIVIKTEFIDQTVIFE